MRFPKRFSLKKKENCIVISTLDSLDKDTCEGFTKECCKHIETGIKRLIIDMAATDFVSSSGIKSVIEVITKMSQNNGKIIFVNLSQAIERSFEVIGILQYAKYSQSLEDAFTD